MPETWQQACWLLTVLMLVFYVYSAWLSHRISKLEDRIDRSDG